MFQRVSGFAFSDGKLPGRIPFSTVPVGMVVLRRIPDD